MMSSYGHTHTLEKHDERIRSLELSRAKFMGIVVTLTTIGSVAGSTIALLFEHFWK